MPVTASRPDIELPIGVRGDVCLETPSGRPASLTATGSTLLLTVPDWGGLAQLGPRSLLRRRRALAALIQTLETLCLHVDIVVAGRPAVALGRGVRTSWLARLLGLSSIDLGVATVLCLIRSRAAPPLRRAAR